MQEIDTLETALITDHAAGTLEAGAEPRPLLRRIAPVAPYEPRTQRWTWLVVMSAFLSLYAFTLATFWAPADGGIDQNAYLVGGKQLALTGSTGVFPASPFEYVGHMFVVPESGAGFYPKYPMGLPVLFAVAIRAGNALGFDGISLALAVSPACAVLAVAGTFFLARALAGSFAAVLASIAFATSQVQWSLANVANSHASCVAFVVWGMYMLLRWWTSTSPVEPIALSHWRGLLSGFLLGFACIIRYTEGLLILPILLVIAFRVRWREPRTYLASVVPLFGWAIPLGAQLVFNKLTIGDWTGYDSSNESEFGRAFTWEKFTETWELMLRTFHDLGMFFTLSIGLAGLGMLFAKSWRVALVMLAWLLPGTLLYTSYYWSPDRGVSYARFFLTFFPAVIAGFAVCLRFGILDKNPDGDGFRHGGLDKNRDGDGFRRRYFAMFAGVSAERVALPITAGAIVAIAAGVSTWRTIEGINDIGPGGGISLSLPAQFQNRAGLAQTAGLLRRHVPKGSVLFSDATRGMDGPMNYLEYAGDWQLFGNDAFQLRGGRRGGPGGGPGAFGAGANNDNPSPMQPRRRDATAALYQGKTDAMLLAEQRRLAGVAFDEGRRVFMYGPASSIDGALNRVFPGEQFELQTVDTWRDLPVPRDGSDSAARASAARRRGNFGGPGGGPQRGPPGGGPGGFGPDSNTEWTLVEITRLRT